MPSPNESGAGLATSTSRGDDQEPAVTPEHLSGGAAGGAKPLPADQAAEVFERLVANVGKVVQGNTDAIRMAVVCLVAEGHLLIEDVPGVGKTSLGKALAQSVDCSLRRVQFTSDLLPSDVTGTSVFNRATSRFEFRQGPIFANIVLGDEINRTPPKTQSALLEAMEERQVTVDAFSHPLPVPFMVIATQNPIEHEGTYPLPTSELDRFLFRIRIGYPERASEVEMLDRHGTSEPLDELTPVASPGDVLGLIERARSVYISPLLQGYIVDIASATRAHGLIALGMSPRAGLALQRAARAWAAVHGRDFVIPDDLKLLAHPVLAHRLEIQRAGRGAGRGVDEVLDEILSRLPVPIAARSHA